jgi:hypothetical protein
MKRLSSTFSVISAAALLAALVGCNSVDKSFGSYEGTWGGNPGSVQPATLPGSQGLAEAMQVQSANTASLMAIDGVIGTGASVSADDAPVVVVFTEKSGVKGIPNTINGVPVSVAVVGKVEALAGAAKPTTSSVTPACVAPNRAAEFARPVPIGVSVGHYAITAGTIGVRVKDKSGKLYLLSNNHVFANTNIATVGDNILQPGPYDGGVNPDDAIATLSAWQPITFCSGSLCPANSMDAALAATTAANAGNATPCDGYGTPSKSVASPIIAGLAVKKYGRTTGLTSGTIAAVNVTINVAYATGTAQFTGQIYIATPNFNGPGDSGSLIVTSSGNKPVGLLFAGTSSATFATPISPILSKFGVTVDGI